MRYPQKYQWLYRLYNAMKKRAKMFAPFSYRTIQQPDNKLPIDYQYRLMKPYRCIATRGDMQFYPLYRYSPNKTLLLNGDI